MEELLPLPQALNLAKNENITFHHQGTTEENVAIIYVIWHALYIQVTNPILK